MRSRQGTTQQSRGTPRRAHELPGEPRNFQKLPVETNKQKTSENMRFAYKRCSFQENIKNEFTNIKKQLRLQHQKRYLELFSCILRRQTVIRCQKRANHKDGKSLDEKTIFAECDDLDEIKVE